MKATNENRRALDTLTWRFFRDGEGEDVAFWPACTCRRVAGLALDDAFPDAWSGICDALGTLPSDHVSSN